MTNTKANNTNKNWFIKHKQGSPKNHSKQCKSVKKQFFKQVVLNCQATLQTEYMYMYIVYYYVIFYINKLQALCPQVSLYTPSMAQHRLTQSFSITNLAQLTV